MKPVIYKIEFPDGSSYIGATTRFAERRRQHLQHHRRGATNKNLAEKFSTYPVCGIYVVASALSLESLHELEAQLIAQDLPDLNFNRQPTPITLGNQRRMRKPAAQARPFGPYASTREAARKLGTSRSHIRRYSSYEAFIAARQPRPSKKQAKCGPPDPRKLTACVRLESGWYYRSEIRKVSPATVRKRMASGMTLEQALLRDPPRSKPFGPFESTASAARALGLSHTHLARLGSYEAYLQSREPHDMSHQIRIAVGDLCLTIKQWSAKNNTPESTIHARRRYGWTDAEAVGEVERQRELVGPKPPTQKQIAKMEAARRKAERERAKAEKLAACEANNRPRVGGCPAEDLAALRERVAQDIAKNPGRCFQTTC